jgi:threonine synthase
MRFTTGCAVRNYASLIRQKAGLQVLSASTAGLIALMTRHMREPLSGDRYVAVLTGGKYDSNAGRQRHRIL